jgi:hypothetical protein
MQHAADHRLPATPAAPAGDSPTTVRDDAAAPLPAAQGSEVELSWDGQRLDAVIRPPALWAELLPPAALVIGLPAAVLGALWLMPGVLSARLAIIAGIPVALALLIAYAQCLRAIVRIIRFGQEPIRIEADRQALKIHCPGQWGPALRRWSAAEIRRLEVYDMPLNLDGQRIVYLRVWSSDYFHLVELHFSVRDAELAPRLDELLHRALGLLPPGTARLPERE